ncbi:energy-coupling factor transporter transmembrane component T [Ectobacillus ponti]|uniref:Energy-coupling factor transporter transmembrane protein EcfT n=1 Tax=Ectobacillus ponti TaxID=2961894 RepID=A0AA41XD62_9BACI|nr:energy-coupling factor transporter transmembrane component T [Ectobacillus ponti]MCP8970710.1 energy-coupling factor transporter transmembrane protein EcfT [Ectobacillus ponti]
MKTAFSFVHPAVSFFYYIGAAVLAMTLLHPVFLGLGTLLLLLLNRLQGNAGVSGRMLRASFMVALFIVIINPLFTHRGRTIVWYLFQNPVTMEAIIYGLTMACSFLLLAAVFISYQQTISSHQFLYLFARFSPKAALLTMIAIRFVPLLLQRLSHIALVQQTKGVQMEHGSVRLRIRHGMQILSVLLVCSLEEALQTADSMQARGFGAVKRSTYVAYRMTGRDWLILSCLLVLFAACAAGAAGGLGILAIYPKLQSVWPRPAEWPVVAAFMLYMSIPILIEGREWVWWRMQK